MFKTTNFITNKIFRQLVVVESPNPYVLLRQKKRKKKVSLSLGFLAVFPTMKIATAVATDGGLPPPWCQSQSGSTVRGIKLQLAVEHTLLAKSSGRIDRPP